MSPRFVTCLSSIALASSAAAAPQTLNPANGHHYEFVPASVSWSQARAAADAATFQGVQGHLATIADAAENAFVFGIAPNGCWIGGFQDTNSPAYSEPLGGWSWVTGEPFSFSAWANNEPNGASFGQNYMELWDIGQWNDTNDQSNPFNSGYVIEYETGPLPVLNPANGHYYLFVSELLTNPEARAAAQDMEFMGMTGHLATLTDAAEATFVRGLGSGAYWGGAIQDVNASDYSEPAGGWRWVTGEPWGYTNWQPTEPNNGGNTSAPSEEYLQVYGSGRWNDTFPTASDLFNYVVEFDVESTPILNPANGKYYLVVDADVCWDEAREAAEFMSFRGAQGHLATITSDSERDFVDSIMPFGQNRWLGGYQDLSAADYSEPAGGWRWTTGEPFTYSDWSFSEPSDGGGTGEAFLELYGTSFAGNGWNDNIQCSTISAGYIVEFDDSIGDVYCLSNPNSTGVRSRVHVVGSREVSDNNVTLVADLMPANTFGFFIQSGTQGYANNPGGSQGALCVAGNIGRYVAPGQVMLSDASGSFSLAIDLTSMPTSIGPTGTVPGQTWNFQAWHRDSVGGVATSNFTNGLSVQFL